MFKKTYLIRIIIITAFLSIISVSSFAGEDDDLMFAISAYNDGFYDVAEQGFSAFVKKHTRSKNRPYALYLLGVTYFVQNNHAKAKDTLNELTEIYPSYEKAGSAYYFLAESSYLTDDYKSARRAYQYVYMYPPEEAEMGMVLFRVGELNFLANDYVGAIDVLSELRNLHKDYEHTDVVRLYLCFSHYYTGDYVKAYEEFKYIMTKPELIKDVMPDARFAVGDTAFNLKKYDRSVKHFTMFLNQYKKDKRRETARYYLAMSYYFTKNKESALKELKTYVKDYPRGKYSGYVNEQLANIYFEVKQYKNANVYLKKLIGSNPGSPSMSDWLLKSAWCYTNLKEYKSATKIYDKLEKVSGDKGLSQDIKFLKAEALFLAKDYVKAITAYEALKKDKKYKKDVLIKLADCHFYLEDYYMSRQYYAEHVKGNSKAGDDVLLKYAISLQHELPADKQGEVLKLYEKIIARNRGGYYYKTALYNAILFYDAAGDKKLNGALKKYVKIKGADIPNYFYLKLANAYYEEDKQKEAMKYYKLVAQTHAPEVMGETLFRLGTLYFKQKNYNKALEKFDLAESTYAGDVSAKALPLIYLEKGNTYEKLKQKDAAIKEYERVISFSADDDLKRVAKERIAALIKQTGK